MLFTIEKVEKHLQEIRAAIPRQSVDIPHFKFATGLSREAERQAHCPDYDDSGWADFQVGDTWGGYDVVAWFRAWVDIPTGWSTKKLALHFLVGPRDGGGSTAETLLYVNGSPLQGIDVWHEQAWLPPEQAAAGSLLVALKAWSGVLDVPDRRRFKLARLVQIDEGAERFYFLADTLIKAIRLLDENDLRRVRLLDLLNRAFLCIDFLHPGSPEFYQSVDGASHFLDENLRRMDTAEVKPRVTGVGHSHIDMAWLWRLSHTREKAARTFSTVINLMRQYPGYRFMHSSPQLYKFLKDDYPEIYQQVRRLAAEGRWEITGGTWVEPDTNLTSGESLIRQFLLGRRFMRDEFGVETNILWLPDVFGYSAALPQIIKKCGLKYFLTSKISWSQFNRFPYDTFRWRSLDGTEVLTHFITTPETNSWFYTYNGEFSPGDVKGIWDNYRQKDVNDELLLLYGWGDGGGGPTQEMIESAQIMKNLPGLPEVTLDASEPYFARLSERLEGKQLPVWDGELYLEYHRGTYTSQAYNKRANRKAEILYHNAEWLSAAADVLRKQPSYPAEELRGGWETILLNQFHDILPGSSIRQVYEDSRQDYDRVREIGEQALSTAQDRLLAQIPTQGPTLVIFNPLSEAQAGLVELPVEDGSPLQTVKAVDGSLSLVQRLDSSAGKKVLIEVPPAPGLGYAALPLLPAVQDETLNEMVVTTHHLENTYFRLQLNECGQITSLFDKRCNREVLALGRVGNLFQLFEDKPMNFDAWDIDIYYQEKERQIDQLVEAVVEETGPLRGVLRLVWRFDESTITQRLTIYRRVPRIDFVTYVDWRQKQVLLKAAFPVEVRSTRATYDVQFGCIERPTHWNTSWDYARFESPAHKWVDLSEGGYGVALLNDCKYGHDIKDNVIRLTLIKSAVRPDPTADQGEHIFTYSLLPHEGDWRQAGVVQAANELNNPLWAALIPAAQSGELPSSYSFACLESQHVLIDTIKQAEDGSAWIVRLYEYQQSRSRRVRMSFGQRVVWSVECNMVEEDEQPVDHDQNGLWFDIKPFEIKTFKVWFEVK